MTLIIRDEEVSELLPMDECIQAMRTAFKSLGEASAMTIPRQRLRPRGDADGRHYWLNVIPGLVPELGVCAVRLDSSVQMKRGEGLELGPYVKDEYCGLVLLYSTQTGELLCIMHDFTLSGIRVGATTAVVADVLGRSDARVMGLFGSGKQARTNLEAVSRVRKLDKVKVYSPNREHCRRFASEMSKAIGCEVIAVAKPREVVQGTDILVAATSAVEPVFEGAWIEPGTHINTIVTGDKFHYRREIDDEGVRRADLVIVSSIQQARDEDHKYVLTALDAGPVYEIGELMAGRTPGRKSPKDVTLYLNNTGLGIQFAAAGAIIYQKAVEAGRGYEIPSELFMTSLKSWADQGYYPSP